MTGDQLITMDINIVLSIVNMKLRDYYDHLETLCDDMDVSQEMLEKRLKENGYVYNRDSNQFISFEA